tara:strand:+ start:134 stop:979 length:846 start_codon:yes stop_codon:yes gene_type:complete
MINKDTILKSGLYLISLPIGNSKDITLRALDYLSNVDEIYCEDTRVTNKILSIHKIKKKLKTYHDHNGNKVRPIILEKIKNGKSVGLVSDAGTPLISDPGYKLVSDVIANNLYVTAAPGVSSPIVALTISGLPTNNFLFLGFLPIKAQQRKNILKNIKNLKSTIIVFESGKRINKTLIELKTILGNRRIALCREMTKKFEEVITGNLDEVTNILAQKKIKGEIVLVLDGLQVNEETINLEKFISLQNKNYSPSELAKKISEQTGFPKAKIYNKIISLKKDN